MAQVEPRKRALVIAVSDYKKKTGLEPLIFCKKDGERMLGILDKLGYTVNKKDGFIGNVNGTFMNEQINKFFDDDDIRSTDTVLFYFSGHGIFKENQHYLAPSNIDQKYPGINGIAFSELTDLIGRCNADCVVTILDCCYAGDLKLGKGNKASQIGIIKDDQEKKYQLKQGKGKCLLSACSSNERAFSDVYDEQSFFTRYLVDALMGKDRRAVNDNGTVTPSSIVAYIKEIIDELREKGKPPEQEPIWEIDKGFGNIILAFHPNLVKKPEMVEETLLSLLKKGEIKEFNKLKKAHPNLIINLRDLDLLRELKIDLAGIDLANANLINIDFSVKNLRRAKFDKARFILVNFDGSDLQGASFANSDLRKVHFAGANLSHANLESSNLERAVLNNVNLSGANLHNAILRGANLENANFTGSKGLERADLKGTNLRNTILKGLMLNEINLGGVDLEGADLSYAELRHAIMHKAILKNAKLVNADLTKTNLIETNLKNADLSGANLLGTIARLSNFKNARLVGASCDFVDLRYSNFESADFRSILKFIGIMLDESVLSNANLEGLHLIGANLTRTNLQGANLKNAVFEGSILKKTILKNSDLRGANLSSSVMIAPILDGAKLDGAKMPDPTSKRLNH